MLEKLHNQVDVLVIGGGTAGTIAAIQAGRAGASTMLIERGSQLGGVTTTGGVSFPGLFHAWGRQIIAGIGWELVKAASDMEDRQLPDFTQIPQRHWRHQVRINGGLYAALAEHACVEAGVHLCYYECPVTVTRAGRGEGDGWTVQSIGKGIDRTIQCRQLIDCTGGADIAGLLGLPRLRDAQTQPGTLIFELGNYDVSRLDEQAIQKRFKEALASGALQPGDVAYCNAPFINFLRCGGVNANHVFDADGSTAVTQTRANVAGRQSLLRLLRFIRTLPGCEKTRILSVQQETAIRETYRIVGEVQITQADYTAGRYFDDAVCYAFYPIDLHTHEGVKPEPLAEGVVPTIPLRALAPRQTPDLLVAGRSVSSDRLANSALRVQASSMATGQAAGAAAALAARSACRPLDVPFEQLRTLLAAHTAIVPTPTQA